MGQLNAHVLLRIPKEVDGRLQSLGYPVHLFPQQPPVEDDPLVRLRQLLLVPLRQRTLGYPGHVVLPEGVVRDVLPSLVQQGWVVVGEILEGRYRHAGRHLGHHIVHVEGVGVVHGHAKLVGCGEDVREEHWMADAPVGVLLRLVALHPPLDDAVLEDVEADAAMVRDGPKLLPGRALALVGVVGEVAVEPLGVGGVKGVLHTLEPVAGQLDEVDLPVGGLVHQPLPAGEQRRRLRAHVREDEAAQGLHAIGVCPDTILEGAIGRLRGGLQAAAGLFEEPAVVGAAQAVLLRDAVLQRDAPVGAGLLDQTQLPAPVLVEDQVFAQQAHLENRFISELGHRGDGMPVTAHQVPHGRPPAHLGQSKVLPLR